MGQRPASGDDELLGECRPRFSDRPEEQLANAETREVIDQAIAALGGHGAARPRQQVGRYRGISGWRDAGSELLRS